MSQFLAVAVALAAVSCSGSSTPTPTPQTAVKTPASDNPLAADYAEVAAEIIAKARADGRTWKRLEHLVVDIGPRLAGSAALEEAITWAEGEMKKDGHENVRVEKVMVPNWKRGAESAVLTAPRPANLRIIGIGGTIATPKGGLEAEVVVVSSKEELDKRKAEVAGKIVLFNPIMAEYDRDKGDGYDEVYKYRSSGADWASEYGAVAMLVRSLTTHSLSTPHTGGLRYEKGKKIPAAAITTEDAELIARLSTRHTVKLRIDLQNELLPDVESGNVIAELVGREKPEEIVVIGAHIDAWDVGGGAHDDGGGCVVMMQALTILREMNLRPRRTIRVVLWTNEENGLRGAIAYAQKHATQLDNHVVAVESDGGVFAPRGFLVEGERGLEHTKQVAALLSPLKEMEVRPGFSGADLIPMIRGAGVLGVGHWVEGEKYFDYHHTEADTIDKVDPRELADNVAVMAVFAYVAADMPERFGGLPGPKPPAPTQ